MHPWMIRYPNDEHPSQLFYVDSTDEKKVRRTVRKDAGLRRLPPGLLFFRFRYLEGGAER